MNDRQPVPLRCNHCDCIIFQDQEWEEYDGGDCEGGEYPWHSECAEAHRLARKKSADEHRKYLDGLRKRNFDALSYDEAMAVAAADTAKSLIDLITYVDKFDSGATNK